MDGMGHTSLPIPVRRLKQTLTANEKPNQSRPVKRDV